MNVLLIGLGSIGKKHVDALVQIDPATRIYALRSSNKTDSYKDVLNIYRYEELSKLELDFAIIASPTYKHVEDINKALALDIPLFIEKPLAHHLDLDNLLAKVQSTQTKTYVACNLRFLDCLLFVKDYLQDNPQLKINEVNTYCGSYLPEWRVNQDFKQSYSASEELGGGVHLDLIHELDYIYWFFGYPNKIHRTLKSSSSLDISAVDYANYVLGFDNFEASVILNYYRRDAKRSLEIIFDEHTLQVDLLKNEVSVDGKPIFQSKQLALNTYVKQLEYFIAHLGKESLNTIEEAIEVLKICLPK